ncbi:M50 family metallopeptidase [Cohnella caldifontis]|uniref:M50 family metallopeptidase n=1 Tax=Cohnella caldifontis TaxID=3027471 RepID=UPI0023EC4A9B|nr:M50 family metallopeptidase [Cohnella sp. YIM B05605]
MNWKFIGYFAIALLVIQIPVVGTFFKIANTLIHESSHAIMAQIMQGKVYQIQLFANTEGVTYTASTSDMAAILTSLAGYIGSSVAAFGLAVLNGNRKYEWTLWLFVILAALNAVLWVRNAFGITWLALFIGLLLFALRRQRNWPAVLSVGLFVFVLAESVTSSFEILWLSLNLPAQAGDAANLARETSLPAMFWGMLFMVQAIVFGFLSLRTANRKAKMTKSGLSL